MDLVGPRQVRRLRSATCWMSARSETVRVRAVAQDLGGGRHDRRRSGSADRSPRTSRRGRSPGCPGPAPGSPRSSGSVQRSRIVAKRIAAAGRPRAAGGRRAPSPRGRRRSRRRPPRIGEGPVRRRRGSRSRRADRRRRVADRTRPAPWRRARRSGGSRSGRRGRASGLVDAVDVGVEAVALVGELLEQGVVVVAHPDADADQLDAGRGVVADAAQDPVGVGEPDVGDAVRGEDDAVDAVLGQRPAGLLVAEPEAGLEVRRAARLELVDGAEDRAAVVRAVWTRSTSAGVVAEGDDRDAVVRDRARRRGCRSASFTSSSRPSRSIEPDVSMTNVSDASWRWRSRTSRAWRPIRTRTSSGPMNGRRAAVGEIANVVVAGAR